MQLTGEFENNYLSGKFLYGDDLDDQGIQQWFAAEENGYYQLASNRGNYAYSYYALNEWLVYRHLNKHYRCCVALGCAAGHDVAPLAPRVQEFVAIEPAERWWNIQIGGKPARYLRPSVHGDISLPDAFTDLFVALAVLHHIPNVSHVLDEISRVLVKGGHLILREPISSMGDWRKKRQGLTANERGLPIMWLEQALKSRGFETVKRAFCCFPPLARLLQKAGIQAPYNHKTVVLADHLLCWITQANLHYHRDRIWQKLAPGAVLYLVRKV